jgi:NADH:ubiquinone oxidoreductase subunit E
MKEKPLKIKRQLFICTNIKENGACCGAKGSLDLVSALKEELREKDLWYQYKVTKTGCLGGCADGINAHLYPDKKRFEKIQVTDKDELLKELLS